MLMTKMGFAAPVVAALATFVLRRGVSQINQMINRYIESANQGYQSINQIDKFQLTSAVIIKDEAHDIHMMGGTVLFSPEVIPIDLINQMKSIGIIRSISLNQIENQCLLSIR